MNKIKPITPAQWAGVCEFNKTIMQAFLSDSTELSRATYKAYESSLRVWFIWVKDFLNDKSQLEIKALDFKRFQNWMINRGSSSYDITGKRAAVSSLNSYIEIYYNEQFPLFRNFINKSIKRPPKADVHPKEPLTKAEFKNLIETLKGREEWQKVAYLMITLDTGCRRAESRQLLKSIVDAEPVIKEKDGKRVVYFQTHKVRCKGPGATGKVRQFMFGEATMESLKKWMQIRGADDCKYLFICRTGEKVRQVGQTCFNNWAATIFTKIIGRRCHPHMLRRSRATQLSEEDGVDIDKIRKLLGHENIQTTQGYIVKDDSDDLDDLYT